MKKFLVLILLFIPLSMFGANLAISTFNISGQDVPAEYNDLLIDLYTSALSQTPGINLVERCNLDKVLKEIEFSLSNLVDSNTALQAGKLMGAAFILNGSLIGFENGFFVSVQVIDNTTGAVILAFRGKHSQWERHQLD